MSLDELLASVRRTYAAASSYSDSGRVLFSGGSLDGTTATFETRFERDGRVLSLRYSDGGPDDLSLLVDADHIEIKPPALHSLLRTNSLSDAIAILTGVTSGVALHVSSMLLPDAIPGPSPCSEDHAYRVKQAPSMSHPFWVLESLQRQPHHEIVIGEDGLLCGYKVRGTVTDTTDLLIEYAPRLSLIDRTGS